MKQVTFVIGDLKKLIKKLIPFSTTHSVVTSLDSTLINVTPSGATFQATNLDTHIKINAACTSFDEFSMLVNLAELNNLLNELPEGQLEIKYDEEHLALTIETPIGKLKLPGHKVEDFPAFPFEEEENNFTINDTHLAKISKALHFVSKDTLRPAMTGILMEMEAGTVRYVATDAHTLFQSEELELPGCCQHPIKIVIPGAPLKTLIGFGFKEDITVILRKKLSQVSFVNGDITITVRLIDATFPPYKSVIPQHDTHLSLTKSLLDTRIRFTNLSANGSSKAIVMSIENDSVVITSQDIDNNKESNTSIEILNKNCPDFKISFNAELMLKSLSQLGKEVTMHTSGKSSQAVTLKDESNTDTILVMPIAMAS